MCKRLVLLSALAVIAFAAAAAHSQSVVIRDDFETSYGGWTDTGAYTKVSAVAEAGYNSARGLKITGRRSPAEGAVAAKSFYLDAGETYGYGVYVKHGGKTAETFSLTLRHTMPAYGTYGYAVVATAKAEPNRWVRLEGSYATPKGSLNPLFFITTDGTSDFCFDEFTAFGRSSSAGLLKTLANEGLKDVYAKKFRVGTVLNSGTVNNATITAMVKREFNSVTCENEMKPDATIRSSGSTNDNIQAQINSGAANILNFCSQNGIGVRGHTLTWHAQTPQWFFKDNLQNGGNWVTPAVMDKRLESYIKNLFDLIKTQYPNVNLYAYDVTNEAVSDNSNATSGNKDGARDPGYNDGKSPWVQIYGNNTWIEKAFTYARRHAPSTCKLFYNDYNEYWDHKRDCIARAIIAPLKQKGILDGMGMQSHINADVNGFTGTSTIKTAINKYADLGVEVQLTELDISTEGGKFSLEQQATKYAQVFQAALDSKSRGTGVTAVCVWGPNDANSWVGTDKESGRSNAPLLFDKDTQKKPAYNSVFALVPQSEWGDGNNPSFGGNPTPAITVSCNVDNLSSSYISGAFVPRPNVSCGTGTPGTASFSINGAAINGWSSPGGTQDLWNTGSRRVVLNSLACGTTVVTPPAPVTCGSFEIVERQNPDADGYYFYHTYEDGTDNGWSGRWANVANTDAQKANGLRALAVTGRNESYTGAEYSLKANAFVPGAEYSFSVLAMYPAADGAPATDDFKFTMTYTLNGEVVYDQIATSVANAGAWVMLENRNFAIPAGATGLVLYVEMPNNETGNFFIDDAMGGAPGTTAPGSGGVTSVRGAAAVRGRSPLVKVRARTLAVNAPEGSSVRVKVVGLNGKTVAAFNSTGSANFSLRKIPAGAYIIEAAVDKGRRTASVVMLR
jgi:GH35 family endo-1,4-beta-xylanase